NLENLRQARYFQQALPQRRLVLRTRRIVDVAAVGRGAMRGRCAAVALNCRAHQPFPRRAGGRQPTTDGRRPTAYDWSPAVDSPATITQSFNCILGEGSRPVKWCKLDSSVQVGDYRSGTPGSALVPSCSSLR